MVKKWLIFCCQSRCLIRMTKKGGPHHPVLAHLPALGFVGWSLPRLCSVPASVANYNKGRRLYFVSDCSGWGGCWDAGQGTPGAHLSLIFAPSVLPSWAVLPRPILLHKCPLNPEDLALPHSCWFLPRATVLTAPRGGLPLMNTCPMPGTSWLLLASCWGLRMHGVVWQQSSTTRNTIC